MGGRILRPKVGEPGSSQSDAAAVFNDHNPWHPVMPDVTRYIERTSFLLRQGQPANQVALLLPTDDAWARFSPGKVSVTAEMDQLITPALMSSILWQATMSITSMRMPSKNSVSIIRFESFPRPTVSLAETLHRDSAVYCWWWKGHRGGAGSVAKPKWRGCAGFDCTLPADF